MLNKKSIYLIIAVTIGLIISWQFTIKNTFDYKNQLQSIGLEDLETKNQRLGQLAQQNRLYVKALNEKNISNIETQEALFNCVEQRSSISIKNFNNEFFLISNNLKTAYHQIELEGSYQELILTLDELLTKSPKLELLHFKFSKKRKNFREKEKLSLSIVLIEKKIMNI